MSFLPSTTDVAIAGGGAAGLATAIFARRAGPGRRVVVLEGARTPGAKILISGGGRCNVTNAVVVDADFWGGKRTIVRHILRGLSVSETAAFFSDLGVLLHEEPGGKLFPNSNRARDVLDALLRGVGTAGAELLTGTRVRSVERDGRAFRVDTTAGLFQATALVLATGGRSLPKSGSDGGGYRIAEALGHTLVPQTPALAPLILDPGTPHSIHRGLSGVALDAEVTVWVERAAAIRLRGALLWTHFGISGPLALNASRHWARAAMSGQQVQMTLNLCPGERFDEVDARWVRAGSERPGATLRSTLAARVPDAVAVALLSVLHLPQDGVLADLRRQDRRRLIHAITGWPLPVADTRGYNYAEVTAGGVPLSEIDPATMESRVCPGLYLAGEILDVDGRIGGFNFQWAWSSAALAGRAVARSSLS
jgi:predicted Rossmann fold flavoprotein